MNATDEQDELRHAAQLINAGLPLVPEPVVDESDDDDDADVVVYRELGRARAPNPKPDVTAYDLAYADIDGEVHFLGRPGDWIIVENPDPRVQTFVGVITKVWHQQDEHNNAAGNVAIWCAEEKQYHFTNYLTAPAQGVKILMAFGTKMLGTEKKHKRRNKRR
jgi:hypothetical protein